MPRATKVLKCKNKVFYDRLVFADDEQGNLGFIG